MPFSAPAHPPKAVSCLSRLYNCEHNAVSPLQAWSESADHCCLANVLVAILYAGLVSLYWSKARPNKTMAGVAWAAANHAPPLVGVLEFSLLHQSIAFALAQWGFRETKVILSELAVRALLPYQNKIRWLISSWYILGLH